MGQAALRIAFLRTFGNGFAKFRTGQTGGCFLRHDAIRYFDYDTVGEIVNAFIAHDRGFFVGNHPFDQSFSLSRDETIKGGEIHTRLSSQHSASGADFVPVGEVEAGVEYGYGWGRTHLFVRGGFAAQRWWRVGSPSGTTGDLSFIGGTALVGLLY